MWLNCVRVSNKASWFTHEVVGVMFNWWPQFLSVLGQRPPSVLPCGLSTGHLWKCHLTSLEKAYEKARERESISKTEGSHSDLGVLFLVYIILRTTCYSYPATLKGSRLRVGMNPGRWTSSGSLRSLPAMEPMNRSGSLSRSTHLSIYLSLSLSVSLFFLSLPPFAPLSRSH